MRSLSPSVSSWLLFAPLALLFLAAPATADQEPQTRPAKEQGTSFDIGRLSSKTCAALDAIGVAASDSPDNPTGAASGSAVWGCYFGAFVSMGGAPMLPGIATACATAFGGMVGAYLEGQSWLSVLLWSLPGIAVGALLSVAGIALALSGVVVVALLGTAAATSAPVLAIAGTTVLLFSLASLLSGPLTLMGVVYAEEQWDGNSLESAAPPRYGDVAQRF